MLTCHCNPSLYSADVLLEVSRSSVKASSLEFARVSVYQYSLLISGLLAKPLGPPWDERAVEKRPGDSRYRFCFLVRFKQAGFPRD